MARRNDRACINCFYWVADTKAATPVGDCVAGPPTPLSLHGVHGVHYHSPRTSAMYFCGCWEPKETNAGLEDVRMAMMGEGYNAWTEQVSYWAARAVIGFGALAACVVLLVFSAPFIKEFLESF